MENLIDPIHHMNQRRKHSFRHFVTLIVSVDKLKIQPQHTTVLSFSYFNSSFSSHRVKPHCYHQNTNSQTQKFPSRTLKLQFCQFYSTYSKVNKQKQTITTFKKNELKQVSNHLFQKQRNKLKKF